jgi:uncharacterized protein YbaP (TraB family)
MALPTEPATLSVSEIDALNQQLALMRHDINNHLSLILAAVELIRRKPEALDRMAATLTDQPPRITEAMNRFSATLEGALNITRS